MTDPSEDRSSPRGKKGGMRRDDGHYVEEGGRAVYAVDANGEQLASLERLVEKLTTEGPSDPMFLSLFLLVFRSFTTPAELFSQLVKRFDVQPPGDLKTADQIAAFKKTQMQVRVRVCNVFKNWLQNHFYDFDKEHVKEMLNFIRYNLAINGMETSSQTLLSIIENKLKSRIPADQASSSADVHFRIPPPKPIISVDTWDPKNLAQMSALEIARQLTLLEYESLATIKTPEFLRQAWLKQEKAKLAPGIVAHIARFNRIASWAAGEVISQPTLPQRKALLEQFIRIAEESYNLQNYSTMLQIISGLKQTSVQRLKDLWVDLPPRIKKVFDDLDTQFRPVGNWNSARMLLKTKQPPILPHLGMFLTDLVFIEEGAPDIVDGLINFEKHRKIAQIIKQIEGYQNSPFPLEPVPCVREYLVNMKVLAQAEITERSNTLLPRAENTPGGSALVKSTSAKKDPIAVQAAAASAATSTVKSDPKEGRKLSMLLSSPWQQQSSFTLVIKTLLTARFPGSAPSAQWSAYDRSGIVYGWPDTITLDIVDAEGFAHIVYSRNHCNRADISLLKRLVYFYNATTSTISARGVLIALMMYEDDVKLAEDLGFEVLTSGTDMMPSALSIAASPPGSDTTAGNEAPISAFAAPRSAASPPRGAVNATSAPMNNGSAIVSRPSVAAGTSPAVSSAGTPPSPAIVTILSSTSLAPPLPTSPVPVRAKSPMRPMSPVPGASAPAAAPSPGLVPISRLTPEQAAAALNAVDNWTDLLTLADIPPDFVILYERVLRENDVGFDQAPTITLDLLNSLGFKMGHLMKIMKTAERLPKPPATENDDDDEAPKVPSCNSITHTFV